MASNCEFCDILDINEILEGSSHIDRLQHSNRAGFRLKFTRMLEASTGEEIKPSILVYDDIIEKYRYKERFRNYLNHEQVNNTFVVFVYGKIDERTSPVSGYTYINIDMENLDFIDFKSMDYLRKLSQNPIV